MGKSDFLTPKAIGNRMKAKGLQKLRWFCQVCQKQCRDENGFKCHTTSESHQRQMLIVASDPDKFLSGYSEMFEKEFLESVRRRHGTKRMAANVVYNEYIADKLHIHMNATQWTTLGGFVQYLGRTGKCIVDETEKGWFLQYVDRDPRAIARQEELDKKKKAELDHEERNRLFIERQLKMAREATSESIDDRPTKLQRRGGDEKVTMSLKVQSLKDRPNTLLLNTSHKRDVFGGNEELVLVSKNREGKPTRAIDEIKEEDERRKEQQLRRRDEDVSRSRHHENWITTGIVVKVTNKKVGGGKYYKQKGVVVDVKDLFAATVEIQETGDVLQLDQDDLETVIPKIGRSVKIVNGKRRGSTATLLSISVKEFCARVQIESGSRRGEVLDQVEYEDICKIVDDDGERKR